MRDRGFRRAGILGLAALLFVAAAGLACPSFASAAMAEVTSQHAPQPAELCECAVADAATATGPCVPVSSAGSSSAPTDTACPYAQPFASLGSQLADELDTASSAAYAGATVAVLSVTPSDVSLVQTAAPPGFVGAVADSALPLRI